MGLSGFTSRTRWNYWNSKIPETLGRHMRDGVLVYQEVEDDYENLMLIIVFCSLL
jgi:hypothetical protein